MLKQGPIGPLPNTVLVLKKADNLTTPTVRLPKKHNKKERLQIKKTEYKNMCRQLPRFINRNGSALEATRLQP